MALSIFGKVGRSMGSRLGRQLFWRTMALLLLVTVASVAAEIHIALRNRSSIHEDSLRRIIQAMDNNIERAIWEVNSGSLETIAHSISSRPEVEYAQISAGAIQIAAPAAAQSPRRANCHSLISIDYKNHAPFGRPLADGRLDVCMRNVPISAAEFRSILGAALPRIASIIIAALGVLMIFQPIVLRRLSVMTARLKEATLFTPEDEAQALADTKDELGTLYYELVRRTKRLEATQGELEAAFETIAAGIAVTGDDLTIKRVNDMFDAILGGNWTHRAGEKLNPDDLLLRACLWKIGEHVTLERHNGAVLEAIARPMNPSGYLITVRDQTEKHRMYQRNAISQKTEAIGRLAGGIAHDFNNILAIIQGNAQIGLLQAAATPDARKRFAAINEAAKCGAALTEKLRTYTRRDSISTSSVSPKDAIEKLVQFVGITLGAQIRFETEVETKRTVICDRDLLDAALLNLAINAIDAIKEAGRAGRIAITAADTNEGENAFVSFSISDNGSGIPLDNLDKVIDPFFTTKEHGTGLGLAAVSSFASQSGGQLKILSTHGEGTKVVLLLPASGWIEDVTPANDAAPLVNHKSQSLNSAPELDGASDRGNILIVDDDQRVGEAVADMLGQLGYRTVYVADQEGAVQAMARNKFDAVVCDVFLACHRGTDVYRMISLMSETASQPPFVFISGHADQSIRAELAQLEGTVFLDKPVQLAELNDALDMLLTRSEAVRLLQHAEHC